MTFIPGTVPPHLQAQVAQVIASVDGFAQLHQVQKKETKKLIPWATSPMQEKIFSAVEQGHKRIVILKARQVYATTGCKMVLHHLAYTCPNAAMHAVISMRDDSATALLDDNRRWLDDPPALLRRPVATRAKGRIVYADTSASVQAFTSRSTTGLRSFTPAAAVVSEAAFASDLEETIAQLDGAVGEGLLILESTANNPNDFFSKLIKAAPENGWHLITMWWWEHPLYTSPDEAIPSDFEATLTNVEKGLQTEYGLTVNQLHWRRTKLLSLGSDQDRKSVV